MSLSYCCVVISPPTAPLSRYAVNDLEPGFGSWFSSFLHSTGSYIVHKGNIKGTPGDRPWRPGDPITEDQAVTPETTTILSDPHTQQLMLYGLGGLGVLLLIKHLRHKK